VYSGDAIGTGHGMGRLNEIHGNGAWFAQTNEAGQWWQMDLGSPKQVIGVVTQGRHIHSSQYVSSYTVNVSSNGSGWSQVDGGHVFTGNDATNDAKVWSRFATQVQARYVRIVVQTWNSHIALRAGLWLQNDENITAASTYVQDCSDCAPGEHPLSCRSQATL